MSLSHSDQKQNSFFINRMDVVDFFSDYNLLSTFALSKEPSGFISTTQTIVPYLLPRYIWSIHSSACSLDYYLAVAQAKQV